MARAKGSPPSVAASSALLADEERERPYPTIESLLDGGHFCRSAPMVASPVLAVMFTEHPPVSRARRRPQMSEFILDWAVPVTIALKSPMVNPPTLLCCWRLVWVLHPPPCFHVSCRMGFSTSGEECPCCFIWDFRDFIWDLRQLLCGEWRL